MKIRSLIAACVLPFALAVGTAQAHADAVVVDDEAGDSFVIDDNGAPDTESYAVDDEGDRIVEPRGGPAVYGWRSERPLDCGTYHFWNGEECVDARLTPSER